MSSSAALEVVAMMVIAAAFEIEIEPREIAILCQKFENVIVGAPCGIMDQMSSACDAENQLLSMICQPAELRGTIEIPEHLAVWGIDSGIPHSVGAGDYGSVRTGGFVGYRMIAELAGLNFYETETDGVVRNEDAKWNGYLANITPAEFAKNFAAHLPEKISGAEFLTRYKGITDTITKINSDNIYAVLNPTAHQICENFRVHQFAELLNEPMNESTLHELGDLMYQSHKSYSTCSLGTDGTDLLVELVAKSEQLYGAKITGGGSGGSVAVLGRKDADAEIKKVTNEYKKQTNYQPYIFSNSSPGAASFEFLKLK